jgi:hypothetical protein
MVAGIVVVGRRRDRDVDACVLRKSDEMWVPYVA